MNLLPRTFKNRPIWSYWSRLRRRRLWRLRLRWADRFLMNNSPFENTFSCCHEGKEKWEPAKMIVIFSSKNGLTLPYLKSPSPLPCPFSVFLSNSPPPYDWPASPTWAPIRWRRDVFWLHAQNISSHSCKMWLQWFWWVIIPLSISLLSHYPSLSLINLIVYPRHTNTHTEIFFEKVDISQCDQIRQNFATLAEVYQSLTIYWGLDSIWQHFLPLLANFYAFGQCQL